MSVDEENDECTYLRKPHRLHGGVEEAPGRQKPQVSCNRKRVTLKFRKEVHTQGAIAKSVVHFSTARVTCATSVGFINQDCSSMELLFFLNGVAMAHNLQTLRWPSRV